ncbi:MAG: hypothetical protein HUJ25_04805 [Crocinitomicaceae bacterium]|nr:hypothetical protein [Crocinitomicaceae bacterium]
MLDSLEIAVRDSLIMDPGPMYHEFHADCMIREPWNAFSSLAFFIPVIFWIWKLRGKYRQNLIIVALLPLLFLNGLGSTLFHAFRAETIFLYLDFMPAMAMSILLSTYLWTRVVRRWYFGIIIVFAFYVAAFMLIGIIMRTAENTDIAPNLGYFFTGACFLTPILIILFKTKFYRVRFVVLTFLFLALALLCRASDYPTPNPFPNILPQGTHFMWHIFSSFAVFTMGYYIFFINKINLYDKSTYPKSIL